mmetsp:Transcript_52173/g.167143  ORF Transcript_52173/g.167143 Transcript_52173/m.167143 type:complete len:216 (-) Transcript_52173:1829-2476(-)
MGLACPLLAGEVLCHGLEVLCAELCLLAQLLPHLAEAVRRLAKDALNVLEALLEGGVVRVAAFALLREGTVEQGMLRFTRGAFLRQEAVHLLQPRIRSRQLTAVTLGRVSQQSLNVVQALRHGRMVRVTCRPVVHDARVRLPEAVNHGTQIVDNSEATMQLLQLAVRGLQLLDMLINRVAHKLLHVSQAFIHRGMVRVPCFRLVLSFGLNNLQGL